LLRSGFSSLRKQASKMWSEHQSSQSRTEHQSSQSQTSQKSTQSGTSQTTSQKKSQKTTQSRTSQQRSEYRTLHLRSAHRAQPTAVSRMAPSDVQEVPAFPRVYSGLRQMDGGDPSLLRAGVYKRFLLRDRLGETFFISKAHAFLYDATDSDQASARHFFLASSYLLTINGPAPEDTVESSSAESSGSSDDSESSEASESSEEADTSESADDWAPQVISMLRWEDAPRHSQAPSIDRLLPYYPEGGDSRRGEHGWRGEWPARDSGRDSDGPSREDRAAPQLRPEAYYRAAATNERELDAVRADLEGASVIPEVLPATFAPEFAVGVRFGGVRVDMGQLLSAAEVRDEPAVEFDAASGQLFAVAIVDPDAPSVSRHELRSYRHYLLGNLGARSFDTLTPFEPPRPPPGPAHRYVAIVFRQHAHIDFGPEDVPRDRARFDPAKWARELN
ncbi:hypothetical protein IWQ56_004336, partial [Coemansia nantahalensis]